MTEASQEAIKFKIVFSYMLASLTLITKTLGGAGGCEFCMEAG